MENKTETKQEEIPNDHIWISKREFKNLINEMYTNGLERPMMLLDVGCKDDKLRNFFAEMKIQWIGTDICPAENVIKSDMNETPFPDGMFNFIFASHSYEHTETPVKTLKEFQRISGPGAIIFMNTPYPTLTQLFGMDKGHINVLSEMQMEKMLYHSGLVPVKIYLVKPDENNADTWNMITIARSI